MKRTVITLLAALIVPAFILAAGEAEGASHYAAIAGRSTDFVPRIFNFLIFAALIYYLIADPIRNFFRERREKIASQLTEIENRLQAAKEAKKAAEQTLAESEKKAREILEDARKEAELLSERYRELGSRESAALEHQYRERMEMEERKMQRETIISLLDENISPEDIPLTGSQIIDTLAKKVA
ncbi:MAG TPA: F0F1 ATP synthase subunit B [Nitratifractor salsuginis]|uniref:ATP synthase subunit b n=1 Tax=Nitratifractor salsuginis TaxID=269261 RepID=A0A7V2SJG8_9BACT|nr:F0F1 ATP synthase subunit B [Nitratifractor salsuginis]